MTLRIFKVAFDWWCHVATYFKALTGESLILSSRDDENQVDVQIQLLIHLEHVIENCIESWCERQGRKEYHW